jgi:hypothetical protein
LTVFDSETLQDRFYQNSNLIPEDQLIQRIKENFKLIDRYSAEAMIDLFFLHQNWKTFYKHNDSFRKFLNEELKISPSHAYGIIRSVKCLSAYFLTKGKQIDELTGFLETITDSINRIGIKKLITIAAASNKERRFELLNKLLNGETVGDEDILDNKKEPSEAKNTIKLEIKNNAVFWADNKVLEFVSDCDVDFRKYIEKKLSAMRISI